MIFGLAVQNSPSQPRNEVTHDEVEVPKAMRQTVVEETRTAGALFVQLVLHLFPQPHRC